MAFLFVFAHFHARTRCLHPNAQRAFFQSEVLRLPRQPPAAEPGSEFEPRHPLQVRKAVQSDGLSFAYFKAQGPMPIAQPLAAYAALRMRHTPCGCISALLALTILKHYYPMGIILRYRIKRILASNVVIFSFMVLGIYRILFRRMIRPHFQPNPQL